MKVRFEEAWSRCFEVLAGAAGAALVNAGRVIVVRDLLGRIQLVLEHPLDSEQLQPLSVALERATGPFWSGQVLCAEHLVAPDAVFQSPDLVRRAPTLWSLERLVTGADWGREPLAGRSSHSPPRATLFGVKGGVGRSTALSAWAWHLARQGKKVLVVDLDLESPGVSSLLLPPELKPDFGIVDWFVEDAVGNADKEFLNSMIARSPLGDDTPGRVFVAPCAGTAGSDYLAKLSRVYLDWPIGTPPRAFADRLAELLDGIIEQCSPDVVLLDSRAGLHDLAAVATTRLGAMTFLFGMGSRQTWDGYRIVLQSWARQPPIAKDVRERLRVVASQIPETGRVPYLEQFRQDAYDVFSETLYEEAGPDQIDAFNYDIDAVDAPHDPLKILWSRPMQDWDPTAGAISYDELHAVLGDFLIRATELVLPVTRTAGDQDLG